MTDESSGTLAGPAGPPGTADAPRPKRRVLRRVLAGIGIAVLALVALAGLLYGFGGMERPSAEMRAAYDGLVASGQAAPVDARFHVPIPGCVCHSDDPALQAQHAYRYIRDCSGCHGG